MLRQILSQTLMIKPRREQFFSMFHLRGLFCSAKNFHLAVVLFCAIFILATCERCSLNEAHNQQEFDECKPYKENFNTNSPHAFDGHVGPELVSRHSSVQHLPLGNICPGLNSFCFPSTLTLLNEVGAESEATDASGVIRSEGFSSGLTQVKSNLSWSPEHGIFKLQSSRVISCSSYQPDDLRKFPCTKNDQQADVSSCLSTLLDHETHSTQSGENSDTVKLAFSNGFSTPPVEIKPFLLDWGQKNMYSPSVAFLSVKNVDTSNVLSIYDPYSSNSQFYSCNFSKTLLSPGEIAQICFTFFPMSLGPSSAHLVLQTSVGGFLIQAKGFGVESTYLVKPITGLDVSSSGRWRKNLTLFNPFNEALYVDELTSWISISSANTCCSSKTICSIHSMEESSGKSMMSTKEWWDVGRDERQIFIRPHKNWEVGPQKTETIIELDVSDYFQGRVVGAFYLQLVRSSETKMETVMVPIEVELSPNSDSDSDDLSVSLEALVPCDTSGPVSVALSVRNDAPYVLSFVKISKVGEISENFEVKSVEGLLLFPRSVTQVAIFSYAAHLEILDVNMNCKLLIQINDTRSSQIEIPCMDVIGVCPGRKSDSKVGYSHLINNVDYINGGERSFMQPPFGIEAVDTREADELVLRNWKSLATASSMSVLDDNEMLFPTVQVGSHSSQWIAVKNPSEKPIVAQLILNPGEIIDKCKTSEMHLQPSPSNILVVDRSIAPTRYGFSIAKDALTESLIQPYGIAYFGPIIFQPSNHCEWRSSALIRNNLSGVEWLSLRGFGGSLSLALHDGSDHLQSVDFNFNLPPSLLNISAINSIEVKNPTCSHPLIKEIYAKNTGDFPLEVIRIEVSGSECGLDGFLVQNCKGFSLSPGESVMLQISYQSDFSTAIIQRDLQLALASGILVIPMKASLPIYLLNFCKKSIFWTRMKKGIVVIVSTALLLCLLVCLLFPTFTSHNFKSGKNSSTMKYLTTLLQGENHVSSTVGAEETLPLGECNDAKLLDKGHLNSSSGHQVQKGLISSVLSNENSEVQDGSNHSQNFNIKIVSEKRRRRRKKKISGMGLAARFEVSSSQSGNSTPSSPMSPATSSKQPWPLSPDTEQSSTEARNPFARADDKGEFPNPKPSSNVNLFDNDIFSRPVNTKRFFSAQEKFSATKKAVLLPSATFPSSGMAVAPPWMCHSPILASTSTIAPHARAPGTKLGQKDTLGGKIGVVENFTYDIWGDHLFGVHLSCQSKRASSMSPRAIENNSDSFFVRDPGTLMESSLLNPVSPNVEGNNN